MARAMFFAAWWLFVTPLAGAAVIFDNGMPNPMTGGGLSDTDAMVRQGDDFVLSAGASSITGVRWYGFHSEAPPEMDDFSIWIYETTAGSPNATPAFMFHVGDVMHAMVGDYFVYETAIAPLALTAGQTYVISIFNSTPPGTADDWSWYTSGEGAGFGWLGGDLISIDRDFAFALLGPMIPAPAGVSALSVTGLALLAQRRRFRRTNRG